jgi:L-alanine-DL-glutamate epimerase-like enolase superfamily enzyme
LTLSGFAYVLIETEEGITGLGEASLHSRNSAVVAAINDGIGPYLIGRDATRIEDLWQDIFRGTFWRGGPVLQSALAGIDVALWDLNGKALGVPVYRLLGGRTRDKVMIYHHVGGRTPEEVRDRSIEQVERDGLKCLRYCPDSPATEPYEPTAFIRRGVELMKTAREAVGPEGELIFEAHTRLTPIRAVELCRALEEYRPYFVEDPIRSENPESFRMLRTHTHVPLGTGEQLCHKWQFRPLLEEELIDFVRLDLTHAGGITEGKKIAALAETHYQEMALHYTSSPVATAAMLHLNLSIPNCGVQEHNEHAAWMFDVFPGALRSVDGYLWPPDQPGLGVDIDLQAAAQIPAADGENPRLHRADGSVWDW